MGIVGDRWDSVFKRGKKMSSAFLFKKKMYFSFLSSWVISLLEPFWPDGTGCARGFLSALDAAWMLRSWSLQVEFQSATFQHRIRIIIPALSSQTRLGCWRRGRTYTACSARPLTRISTRTSKASLWTQGPGAGFGQFVPLFNAVFVKVQKYTSAHKRWEDPGALWHR